MMLDQLAAFLLNFSRSVVPELAFASVCVVDRAESQELHAYVHPAHIDLIAWELHQAVGRFREVVEVLMVLLLLRMDYFLTRIGETPEPSFIVSRYELYSIV
jgi:hypothetical protein